MIDEGLISKTKSAPPRVGWQENSGQTIADYRRYVTMQHYGYTSVMAHGSNGGCGDAGINKGIEEEVGDRVEMEKKNGKWHWISGQGMAIGFAWEAIKRQFEVDQQGIPQLLAV